MMPYAPITEACHARNIVVISDNHGGDRLGLCPPGGVRLDGGGKYYNSGLQNKLWEHWLFFRNQWVPHVTKREPFILIHNGDALDGNHHNATTQISHNLCDQNDIAYASLKPLVDKAAAYYHVRGTEAHTGPSGAEENRLARRLGAIQDCEGNFARWELWLSLYGHLCHFTHHIGTTGSSSYEATAVGKEMVENYVESGRWGSRAAQVIVRSHRHRFYETRHYSDKGLAISVVTPAWQLKGPFVFRTQARMSEPQIGGILIRVGDEELHTRAIVWPIKRSRTEVYGA
jgi:hypothetical protein